MQAAAVWRRFSAPALHQVTPDGERARRNTTGSRKKQRRKSSFARLIEQAAAVKPDTRPVEEKSLGDLVDMLVKRGARTSDAVRPTLDAWCEDHPRFREQAMPLCVETHINLRRSFDKREGSMRGIVHLKTVMLLLGECACDLELLCISFWLRGDMISLVYAIFLTVILAFSAVVQALSACFYTREGPLTALVALTGLKVVVEARRALWEIAPGASRRARETRRARQRERAEENVS